MTEKVSEREIVIKGVLLCYCLRILQRTREEKKILNLIHKRARRIEMN